MKSCIRIHIMTVTDMIENPFETKSDSFYFVDGKLIMHNKASYKVSIILTSTRILQRMVMCITLLLLLHLFICMSVHLIITLFSPSTYVKMPHNRRRAMRINFNRRYRHTNSHIAFSTSYVVCKACDEIRSR